jgi:hypothetical protein
VLAIAVIGDDEHGNQSQQSQQCTQHKRSAKRRSSDPGCKSQVRLFLWYFWRWGQIYAEADLPPQPGSQQTSDYRLRWHAMIFRQKDRVRDFDNELVYKVSGGARQLLARSGGLRWGNCKRLL